MRLARQDDKPARQNRGARRGCPGVAAHSLELCLGLMAPRLGKQFGIGRPKSDASPYRPLLAVTGNHSRIEIPAQRDRLQRLLLCEWYKAWHSAVVWASAAGSDARRINGG